MKKVKLIFSVISVGGMIILPTYANKLVANQRFFNNILQERNSITGFVFNESRTPLADAYVELRDDLNNTISRTKTSNSGLYAFRGLPSGRYNVKVSNYNADYEEQNISVSLIPISAIVGGGAINETLDFYLKIKRNANSGPLAAPGVIFVQEVPDSARKLYEAATDDLRNKKVDEGFDKLKKSLELFPDYFLALDRLGGEYVVRGHYAPAYILLTKAVKINPKSFSSLFGLGLASFRLQQYDKALEYFQQATEVYNKSPNAYLWFGIALHQKEELLKAETALNQANKMSEGKSAEVHWQLARLYKDQNRFRESADELELFLKYKPDAEDSAKIKDTIKKLRQKIDEKPVKQ